MSNIKGRYKARAVPNDEGSYAVFTRSGAGNPQVAVKFVVSEGEEQGESIYWYGHFSGGGADFTINALRTLGLQGDDISEAMIQTLDNEVELSIIEETDKKSGKLRPKVQYINSVGGGGMSKERMMSKDDVKMFAAEMKVRMQASKPAVKQAKASATPVGEDPPPF